MALHICFFGLTRFLFIGEKKYLYIAASSILVHFSFIVIIPIVLFYLVAGNRINIYFGFFLISLFISQIDFAIVRSVVGLLPDIFNANSDDYISEERAEVLNNASKKIWYAKYYGIWFQWAIVILLCRIFFSANRSIKDNGTLMKLFSYTFLMFGTANFLSMIPSGGRFLSLAYLFSFLAMALYYDYFRDIRLKPWIAITSPAITLYLAIVIKNGLETFNMVSIFGNPFIAIFSDNEYSVLSMWDFISSPLQY